MKTEEELENYRARLRTVADYVIKAGPDFSRIALAGGPLSGKTLLLDHFREFLSPALPVVQTDDYMQLVWAEQPAAIIAACEALEIQEGGFILSGVQAARCLRRGLKVDAVIYSAFEFEELSSHQRTMTGGVKKIFGDWVGSSLSNDTAVFYP